MRVNQRASYYEDVTSFYDDNFNYYVFEIGSLIDTPLENTYSYINYSGGKISHKFTTTTVSSTSIQETTQSSSTKSTVLVPFIWTKGWIPSTVLNLILI